MEKNEFEIEKIKAETKSIKVKKYIDLVKGILLIIGSIILFIVIQQPEFVLNRQVSEEIISRERAKLILDLTKNSNNNKEVIFGLSVIKNAYPTNDNLWINNIIELYQTKLDKDEIKHISLDTISQLKLNLLKDELNKLYMKKENLQYRLISEISGKKEKGTTTGFKGYGPVAKKIELMIKELNYRIHKTKIKMDKIENN